MASIIRARNMESTDIKVQDILGTKFRTYKLKNLPGRKKRTHPLPCVNEPCYDSPNTVYQMASIQKQRKKDEVNTTLSYTQIFENLGTKPVQELLNWFLKPIKPVTFFREHWEKQPVRVRHSSSNYYNGLYSFDELLKNVEQNNLHYNKEIEVMAYVDGEQKRFEYASKVLPSYLLATLKDGYSIRMRNSQVYSKSLESLCSILQEYFSNHVEANTYVTPANAQDFPLCENDTNAFILQIEGKRLWKLYIPSASQTLSNSNDDLLDSETTEPYLSVVLQPGDLLYIPSGYIYQAQAVAGMCSLHLDISLSQQNTWGNFLRHALFIAIDEATEKDEEFRKSVPKDYMDYMGKIYSDIDSQERQNFNSTVERLIEKTFNYINPDIAADAHGLSFVLDSLPPVLTSFEKECSVHCNGAKFEDGKAKISKELNSETKICFLRRKAFKLVVESDGTHICHSLYNRKEGKEETASLIKVNDLHLPDMAALFKIKNFVKIKDLPNGESVELLDFLQSMYDNGILMTDRPLPFED